MELRKEHKDLVSYATAVLMIISGAVLCYISFFTLHIIESSVLGYLSMSLTFGGAIFGVTLYINQKFKSYEISTNKSILKKLKEQEEDKDKKDDVE